MSKRFDYEYIVIGSGVAGATAAKQLAAAGRKVAVVEQSKWGGSEIHRRNVPQGALFSFSHLYAKAVAGSRFGLSSANLRYNYPSVLRWKERAISRVATTKKELEEAGVTCLKGHAEFVGQYDLSIGEDKNISANKFILASGTELDTAGISGTDSVPYDTPASILDMERPPKTVLVVGGGASGCEVAQYLAELGSKVVIVELSSRLLPKEDEEVGQIIQQYFEKRSGIKTFTQTRVTALERDRISPRVVFMRGGQERTVRVEKIVLATGSKPVLDFGLQKVGVSFDKNGVIVDRAFQTSARNIYAVGDVLGGESSTERAVYSAELTVMNMLSRNKNYANFNGFMRVTNTEPQIATVGLTEDELDKRARKYKKAIVPLSAVQASAIADFRIGFLKLLVDHQNKVLGATMVGPCAAEVLQEIALAVRHGLSLVQIGSTPHVAESWGNIVKVAARKILNAKK